MSSTTNLKISKPAVEHVQKVVTLNGAADDFDATIGGMLPLSVAGSADITLTRVQGLNPVFKFIGLLTGNINVLFPVSLGCARQFTIWNATTGAFSLTVKTTTAGSVGVAITQTKKVMCAHDGTDVFKVSAEV